MNTFMASDMIENRWNEFKKLQIYSNPSLCREKLLEHRYVQVWIIAKTWKPTPCRL